MRQFRLGKQYKRGGILLSVLACIVVVSVILAGVATLAVSHFARAKSEGSYVAALCAAEAGINFEVNKISQGGDTLDQKSSPGTYTTSAGTFTVWVVDCD